MSLILIIQYNKHKKTTAPPNKPLPPHTKPFWWRKTYKYKKITTKTTQHEPPRPHTNTMSIRIEIKENHHANLFVSLFQHIHLFTEQVNLLFEEDRVFMQTMDTAHVSILELTIPKEWFSLYENKHSIQIGLNTKHLYTILNIREENQHIILSYNEETDYLFIDFVNGGDNALAPTTPAPATPTVVASKDGNKHNKTFEIPLCNVENETMNIPEREYEVEFAMSSVSFFKNIQQLKKFGDNIDMFLNEEKIIMSSEKECKMNVIIGVDDLNEFSINEGVDIKISFSLKQLYNICLYNGLSKEVIILVSKNYPLKIIHRCLDGLVFLFYLAPKMTDDDDNED